MERRFDRVPFSSIGMLEAFASRMDAMIIGNKTDAPGRAVTTEEAREHADGLGVPFLETSAKADTNVEEAFLTLASELLRRAPPEKPQKKRLSLAASASAKGRKCCS